MDSMYVLYLLISKLGETCVLRPNRIGEKENLKKNWVNGSTDFTDFPQD